MEESRDRKITRLTEEFRKLLEDKFPKKGSTTQRIEELTEEIGQNIEQKIEDEATKQESRGHVGGFAVCKCGGMSRYVRDYEKRVVTLHGERRIARAYYHRGACGAGFCPIDKTLELDGGCATVAVRAEIARLAALVPFARCSLELGHLCGINVSARTVERVAELVGSQIGAESAKTEAYVLSGQARLPKLAPERLYITVDGAMAPMKEGWRECKVGAVYEASPDGKGDVVARDVEHVATFGNAEAIGDKVYALAFRRGVERCGDVVVLGDGSKWIWNQAHGNFPKATEILDFYHAVEHLSEVAKAWYGAHYDEYRAKGMHIGSGIAESSCKCLVQARLKQSGMRWTEPGAEAILQLRLLWLDAPNTDLACTLENR